MSKNREAMIMTDEKTENVDNEVKPVQTTEINIEHPAWVQLVLSILKEKKVT